MPEIVECLRRQAIALTIGNATWWGSRLLHTAVAVVCWEENARAGQANTPRLRSREEARPHHSSADAFFLVNKLPVGRPQAEGGRERVWHAEQGDGWFDLARGAGIANESPIPGKTRMRGDQDDFPKPQRGRESRFG
jgi:hypothetical protein